MIKKAAIYPITRENAYLLNYPQLLRHIALKYAVTHKNSGLTGSQNESGIIISDSFDEAMAEADALILADVPAANAETLYSAKLRFALAHQKNVYLPAKLYETLHLQEKESALLHRLDRFCRWEDSRKDAPLQSIDIPVVSVMGLGENSGKMEVQLGLGAEFAKRGYKVYQFGFHPMAPLFGFAKLPDFILDHRMSLPQKIVHLNHFLYEETGKQHYDLIIAGTAGGISPYNRYVPNYFGETAAVIAQALSIDANIFCFYRNSDRSASAMEEWHTLCQMRYGYGVDAFYVSNTVFDFDAETKQHFYLFPDAAAARKSIAPSHGKKYSVIHANAPAQIALCAEQIIKRLSNNPVIL